MSATAEICEPASDLEPLIAELSGPGLQGLFVFGVDCQLAHLAGATTPLFRGPADRRWWHVVLGDDAANRTVDVRVDEVTGVRFARRPSLFPAWPGQEVLTVQFLGQAGRACCTASCTTCMTVSGCARRSWRPGGRCASATATATSPGSIEAPSCPRPPELSRSPAPQGQGAARTSGPTCHPQSMSFYDTCVAPRYRNGPTGRRRLTGAEAFELEGMDPCYIDIDGFWPKAADSKGPEGALIAN